MVLFGFLGALFKMLGTAAASTGGAIGKVASSGLEKLGGLADVGIEKTIGGKVGEVVASGLEGVGNLLGTTGGPVGEGATGRESLNAGLFTDGPPSPPLQETEDFGVGLSNKERIGNALFGGMGIGGVRDAGQGLLNLAKSTTDSQVAQDVQELFGKINELNERRPQPPPQPDRPSPPAEQPLPPAPTLGLNRPQITPVAAVGFGGGGRSESSRTASSPTSARAEQLATLDEIIARLRLGGISGLGRRA